MKCTGPLKGVILIKMKKKALGYLGLFLPFGVSLFSCSSAPAVTIELEEGKSATYEYGESFHPLSLGIYEAGEFVRYVEAADLSDFSTTQAAFDTPLSAKVSYQGKTYPYSYQISSLYDFDKTHYVVKLHAPSSLEITFIGNPSKSATDFAIPNQIPTLPEPLKTWNVTSWSASFGGMEALQKVALNSELVSFAPSNIASTIEVIPASHGRLAYDDSGFFTLDSVLWGLSSSLTGEVDLPSSCASFVNNAFAGTHAGITSLHFPTTYADYDLSGLSPNLPDCTDFVLPSPAQGYLTKEGFLYKQIDSEVQCYGVPMGRKLSSNALSLPTGLTRFAFDNMSGCANPTYQSLILPSSLTSLVAKALVTTPYLTTLKLLSPKVVDINALSIKNLPSSLNKIEVPSSLLDSYKSDGHWSKLAGILVGFEA